MPTHRPAPHHIDSIPLTRHAWQRLSQRGIGRDGLLAAFDFGREILDRGASILFIGRNEVARARKRGIDIRDHKGIHVVCAHDGQVITLYRNQELNQHTARRASRRRAA